VSIETAGARAAGAPLTWAQRRFLFGLALPAFGLSLAYTLVTTYGPVLLEDLSGPTVTGALIGTEGILACSSRCWSGAPRTGCRRGWAAGCRSSSSVRRWAPRRSC
jgi:hypothetical protein